MEWKTSTYDTWLADQTFTAWVRVSSIICIEMRMQKDEGAHEIVAHLVTGNEFRLAAELSTQAARKALRHYIAQITGNPRSPTEDDAE